MCYGISKAEEVIYLRLSIPVLTKKKKKSEIYTVSSHTVKVFKNGIHLS